MLRDWIDLGRGRKALARGTLANCLPYADLDESERRDLARKVREMRFEEGLLELPPARGERWYLARGRVQIQTRSGFVLGLAADTPQSRFPLPDTGLVETLYAAEPSTLLAVPVPPAALPTKPAPALRLTPAEATALAALRSYLAGRDCELPTLPDLAFKIGRAIDDPNNRNEDIAQLIQLDPALTTRLLGIVNSAAYGGLKKVTTVGKATTRLGRRKLRNLVYSCLIKSAFKVRSGTLRRRMEALWQRSVHVAALSFVLGRETPGIDPEQALLAGLIHEAGAIAIIGAVARFPELAAREEAIDHAVALLRDDTAMRLLRRWGLHTDFVGLVGETGNWQRVGSAIPELVDVVNVAILHARIGRPGARALPRIDRIPAWHKLARNRLTPQRSLAFLEEAASDVQELRSLLSSR
jgi:HD-like signal output (HDOD) protein